MWLRTCHCISPIPSLTLWKTTWRWSWKRKKGRSGSSVPSSTCSSSASWWSAVYVYGILCRYPLQSWKHVDVYISAYGTFLRRWCQGLTPPSPRMDHNPPTDYRCRPHGKVLADVFPSVGADRFWWRGAFLPFSGRPNERLDRLNHPPALTGGGCSPAGEPGAGGMH